MNLKLTCQLDGVDTRHSSRDSQLQSTGLRPSGWKLFSGFYILLQSPQKEKAQLSIVDRLYRLVLVAEKSDFPE